MSLQTEIQHFSSLIGNTPLCAMKGFPNFFAKLEYTNCMGSIKDRAAFYIMENAIKSGLIRENTTIIESTSGNFGMALAAICKHLDLKFIPVIDPNISREKEAVLKLLSHKVVKVRDRDKTGGYLLTRINVVNELMAAIPNSFNPNQYCNPDNYLAYYHSLGLEIAEKFEKLDYLFVSVSSGGTLTGLSLRLKEKFKNLKVIAIDVEGSLIFSDVAQPRLITGLGASKRSEFINKANVDDFVILSQRDIVKGCHMFLDQQGILGGPSSGAAYLGAKRYLGKTQDCASIIICPDRGNSYLETIYNKNWVSKLDHVNAEMLAPI